MSERDKVPRWVLWLGVSVAIGWLLYTLRGVLAPVFFAFLIAYMLDPLVDRIEESRLLRGRPIARAVGIAVLLGSSLDTLPHVCHFIWWNHIFDNRPAVESHAIE